MRRGGVLFCAAVAALAVAAESFAFSWDEPRWWLPDLAAGVVLAGCGYAAWEHRRERAAGALLAAAGVAWFLGNFDAAALYLHRGPLVHLLLTYPGWRPRTRLDAVGVTGAYAAALAAPVWRSDVTAIVLSSALVVLAARGYLIAGGRARRERGVALAAATAFAVILAGGAGARLAVPAGDAVEPALLAYQAVLAAVAIALVAQLRRPGAAAVADLVVELGETRSGALRGALARALGDPTLDVGFWSDDRRAYVDEDGAPLALPDADTGRSATFVEREGRPYAVLVHDAALLREPALVEAVAAATRLSESNAVLQAEVRAQVAELRASRRRLLVAADDERRRLEERLRAGPERRLRSLAATLERSGAPERAREQLDRSLDDLHELARGLHPRELVEGGLAGALASLAERAPVPVGVDVGVERAPAEVEATVYFLAAEALANVAKYAAASRASIAVTSSGDRLRVAIADDGVGGADPMRGRGLRGLADRVEALGGTFRIESPAGGGTRLAAELPLGGETR